MEKFRWCFIGTGKLGHQVAGQLLASGRHEIVSCYTRNMDNAKAFAEEFHCKAYGSAEEAILADGVEGVYVVTPHNAHFRYVKEALELMLAKNHDYDEAWRSMRISSYTDLILMKIYRTKQIESLSGNTLVSEGIDANYMDMINYSVFGLIKIEFEG